MDAETVLRSLATAGELVSVWREPARPGRLGLLGHRLPDGLDHHLPDGGLWSHQAEAIDAIRGGHHTVVATGTSSGKSLCFQLPIAEAVAAGGTALLLYPTKALGHDQLRALTAHGFPGVVPAPYDGDTDPETRTWARRNANVVLTNPDMLHVGILPNHPRWAPFLARLRFVVVDELHVFRGIFGSHVAHLLRRLRRVCRHHGSDPTFVLSSATVGEPAALAERLLGAPVTAITDDGAPRAARTLALWQPEPGGDGWAPGPNGDSSRITAGLVEAGHRTICFTMGRRSTELVAQHVGDLLGPGGRGRVAPYRGGYLSEDRLEIEERLFAGELDGVVATSALELGIDVGGLDAAVLCGFPGTIAAFRQRAGRVGRRAERESTVVLVAGGDQLDQWLVHHPDELRTRPPEPVVINPANPYVLHPHLAAAAHELPLDEAADGGLWGDDLDDGVHALVLDDLLTIRSGKAVWAGGPAPAPGFGLRTAGRGELRIVTAGGELLGTVDPDRAVQQCHPGAVYLHQGQPWTVVDLDLGGHRVTVQAASGDEYTQARTQVDLRLLGVEASARIGPVDARLGPVEVTHTVVGYQVHDAATRKVTAEEALDLPPTVLETRGLWLELPDDVLDAAGVAGPALGGAIHALEHAAIGVLPLFTICDRWDVGGVSMPLHPATGTAIVVIYDGYPGGAGIADLGHARLEAVLATTRDVIAGCGCATGCPSCVQSPKCGNGNDPLDKAGAAALLGVLLA